MAQSANFSTAATSDQPESPQCNVIGYKSQKKLKTKTITETVGIHLLVTSQIYHLKLSMEIQFRDL